MDKLKFTMYPKGGTAMLTIRQVGEALAGAAEKLGEEYKGFYAWPIAMYNQTWKEFLKIVYDARGRGKNRKIIGIPAWIMKMGTKGIVKEYKEKGIEGLYDRRGKNKESSQLSEVEKLKVENRMLKAQAKQQQMEIDFLKKLDEIERR